MQEVPMKPVCRNDRTGLGAQNRRGKDRPLEQNVRDGIHCAASAAGGAGVQPGMYTAYRIGEFAGAGMKMKQKNGVWLLVTAAVLCSIGGVCIRGICTARMGERCSPRRFAACAVQRIYAVIFLNASNSASAWFKPRSSALLISASIFL